MVYHIAKLRTSTNEDIVPLTDVVLGKNVVVTVFVTFDNGEPKIAYMSKAHFDVDVLAVITTDEFVTLFSRARNNTMSSGVWTLPGYRHVVEKAFVCVVSDLLQFVTSVDRVSAVDMLKRAIRKGLASPELDDKLHKLLEDEAKDRLHHKKAHIIQKHFRHVISDPSCGMCRRRLLFEFNQMQDS
jgi:hypothetical protein